jgi:tetratricopeptide (TPR) repeat protein
VLFALAYWRRLIRDFLNVRTPLQNSPPAFSPLGSALGIRPNTSSFAFTLPLAAKRTPSPDVTADAVAPGAASMAQAAHLYELAITSAAMGFHESAMDELRAAVSAAPNHSAAWHKLADLLRMAARHTEANAAQVKAEAAADSSTIWPAAADDRSPSKLDSAERKLRAQLERMTLPDAMTHLRDILFSNPLDAVAMRLLAGLENEADDKLTAQYLLERAVELAPGYHGARTDLVLHLIELREHVRALPHADRLAVNSPNVPLHRSMRADILVQLGETQTAILLLEGLIRQLPRKHSYWLAYGNALRVVGRRQDSLAAYRKCLELAPGMGEAYSGIAALKGNFLTADDIAAMQACLRGAITDPASRQHMCYALASTLERAGEPAASFGYYQQGAAAFRESVAGTKRAHDADAAADRVRRLKKVMSPQNLAARPLPPCSGNSADTPIFVVGMPRAGSTLVEQILASHSQVEGTRELPVMGGLVREISLSRILVTPVAYPECLLDMTAEEIRTIGVRYIEGARIFRHTNRPYFVDKRPWNWLDAGLIHLSLPNAKIIDIRRAPMAACFAMFKELLPADAAFSYDLDALGKYYNGYVSLMDHYDSVLPGRILHVSYENLVENTETEIRRMLDYCGLPFEPSCLRFWETDRAVSTPSAEQVRRPIFRDALEQWRKFEPWLGPLQASLAQPFK